MTAALCLLDLCVDFTQKKVMWGDTFHQSDVFQGYFLFPFFKGHSCDISNGNIQSLVCSRVMITFDIFLLYDAWTSFSLFVNVYINLHYTVMYSIPLWVSLVAADININIMWQIWCRVRSAPYRGLTGEFSVLHYRSISLILSGILHCISSRFLYTPLLIMRIQCLHGPFSINIYVFWCVNEY